MTLSFDALRDRLGDLLDVDLTGVDEATPLESTELGPYHLYLLWRLLDDLADGLVTEEALASSRTFGDLHHWCGISGVRRDELRRSSNR